MAKTKAGMWTDVLMLAGLVTVGVATGVLVSMEDRFTMIGIFCALLISLSGHARTFMGVFLLAGAFILLSFSREPFSAILYVLAADATISTWYLTRVSWARTQDPANLGILATAFLSVFMFLISDLYTIDPRTATYLIFLFYLLKPLSWIRPLQLEEAESRKFEFISCVLSILALSHIFHPQQSIEFSIAAVVCGGILTFFGTGFAAPTLIFLSLVHLVPGWIVFGGVVAFGTLYGGWTLRLLFLLMTTGYTIHFGMEEDPLFWTVAIGACFFMSILFVRKLPKVKTLKDEWQGILLLIVLVGLPIYVDPSLINIDFSKFDGTTLGVSVAFVLFVALFMFWKTKFVEGQQYSFKSWNWFVTYIQQSMREIPDEQLPPAYRVGDETTRSPVIERHSSQILVWLLVVVIAVVVLGGFE